MTINEAKKDVARRLTAAGVPFAKITARTVSFADLARASVPFIKIHGTANVWNDSLFADVPKPSAGGYCIDPN